MGLVQHSTLTSQQYRCAQFQQKYYLLKSLLFDTWFSSVQFSLSVVSNSWRPHESQHTRPPCPSPTPGVYSNSCPSSRWCHPAISSSVVPFCCPQSLLASGFFSNESTLLAFNQELQDFKKRTYNPLLRDSRPIRTSLRDDHILTIPDKEFYIFLVDVLNVFMKGADNVPEQMGGFQWKLINNRMGNASKEVL